MELFRLRSDRYNFGQCGTDMNLPQHVTYGLVVFVAIFIVGWVTGMGGSFWPNLIFSVLMGFLAGGCFVAARKLGGRRE